MITAQVRALLAVVTVITAAGVAAAVVGIADHIAAAVLIAAGLGWLAVVTLRRERRIRARLADSRTRPAACPPAAGPPAAAPLTRVGPGDPTPVSPAPTTRPGTPRDVRAATAVAPTGGV